MISFNFRKGQRTKVVDTLVTFTIELDEIGARDLLNEMDSMELRANDFNYRVDRVGGTFGSLRRQLVEALKGTEK